MDFHNFVNFCVLMGIEFDTNYLSWGPVKPGATGLFIGVECSGGGGSTRTTPHYPVSTLTAGEQA